MTKDPSLLQYSMLQAIFFLFLLCFELAASWHLPAPLLDWLSIPRRRRPVCLLYEPRARTWRETRFSRSPLLPMSAAVHSSRRSFIYFQPLARERRSCVQVDHVLTCDVFFSLSAGGDGSDVDSNNIQDLLNDTGECICVSFNVVSYFHRTALHASLHAKRDVARH